MKKGVRTVLRCLWILSPFMTMGCSNPGGPDTNKSVTITSVDTVLENIHRSFWDSSSFNTPTIYKNFWIYIEESDLLPNDFVEIVITQPNGRYYTFDSSSIERHYHHHDGYFGGWYRLYSTTDPHIAYLGNYTIDVTLTNGASDTFVFDVAAPGSTDSGTKLFAATQSASIPGFRHVDTVFLPEQATISSTSSLSTAADTLNVDFQIIRFPPSSYSGDIDTVDIYSGWIWFFDQDGEYIGYSDLFRDYESGEMNPIINGGSGINSDGTMNSVILAPDDLQLEIGSYIDDIYYFHVVLTDGYQFASTSDTYGSRSISELHEIKRIWFPE